MHAYRFRLLSTDNDSFVRDVELKAIHTFLDFHNIILQCSGIAGDEIASFFVCDHKWNKLEEITLLEMTSGKEELEESEWSEEQPFSFPVHTMADSFIKDFINDPHQRMLYEYDILNGLSFFVELMKIFHIEDNGNDLPRCTLSRGELLKPKHAVEEDVMDEESMLMDFEEFLNGDLGTEDPDPIQ